jgi:hypothetical protein
MHTPTEAPVTFGAAQLSILKNARPEDVRWDPYPHIVIENALDEEIYAALEASYPAEDLVRSAKHVYNRDQIQAYEGLNHPGISPLWKDFMRWHISKEFYQEMAALFAPWVRQLYPWLESEKGYPLDQFTAEVRDPLAASLPDVCLDCQPGLNVVSEEPVSFRSAHLDAHNKLFTGLFYMRIPGDESVGGDLMLHRVKQPPPSFETATTISEDQLEPVRTVRYGRNTAVFFMNSPLSIHGVSVRTGTTVPRRLVNLVAGLYTLKNKGLYPSPPPNEAFFNTRFDAPVW